MIYLKFLYGVQNDLQVIYNFNLQSIFHIYNLFHSITI